MRRLALAAVFLVACGSVPAHAQTLALLFAKGDVFKYSLHLTGDYTIKAGNVVSETFKIDMTAHETASVQSVAADGTADVSLALTEVNLKTIISFGQTTSTTTTTTSIPPEELKVSPDGRIVIVNGMVVSSMSPFDAAFGTRLGYAVLPDGAVKPGDTWTKTYDQAGPAGTAVAHMTSKGTYLRNETFHGVDAAVVETKSTGDFSIDFSKMTGMPTGGSATNPTGMGGSVSMTGTITSDVTSWIDPGAHRVLKSIMKGGVTSTFTIGSAAGGVSPQVMGPVTVKGSQTMDLEPA
jgi:hypothetical protein